MKIAYAGLDLMLPALEALIAEGVEIEKIFTCKVDNEYEFNTEIICFAERHRIPYTLERITAKDIEDIRGVGCDLLVCGAYYYRIPVIRDFPMVNIHPALLPVGRGAWPMPVTILRGFTESGVTLHKMEESFDTGDILLQRGFDVDSEENLETFTEKFRELLPEMMHTLVRDFGLLWENAIPQTEGEYFPDPTTDDYTITDDMSGEECDRVLRAFYGFPCFYGKYTIYKGRFSTDDTSGIPVCGGYITAERISETEETV